MSVIRKIEKAVGLLGISPRTCLQTLSNLHWYLADLRKLKNQSQQSRFNFPLSRLWPCLTERADQSGATKDHYFLQDLRVARRIFELNPARHIDIGSRIDGFVAHVATFRPIEVFDIRPMDTKIHNVTFKQGDLMSLDPEYVECTDSLSCLHTIEHFGLGRYGDPIDFDGFDKGLKNLTSMLKPGGRLHFSTPMGPQRIEFNAHRVFSLKFLLEYFHEDYILDQFSYIDDHGRLYENVTIDDSSLASNYSCRYGCAIFELIRKA
jgi:SAM-dependent methyltransferase